MSTAFGQDALVALVALAAVVVVARRVVGFVRRREAPRCSNCPSGQGDCGTSGKSGT
jgi:hypothetical protein